MGNEQSKKEAFYPRMLNLAESSRVIPDVGIDGSLVKFSGLNSAAELENSFTQLLKNRTPDYVQSLGSALAAFECVPNAVGLGAVALSIALELIIMSLKERESKSSTLDMMRRVFAEEKASGVRDTMEEYLKRLGMYFLQPTQALGETERLEKQLSEQLTRLKNSMLHDNQMSSRSMRHWTNGAAFHLQMLIHAARLKMQSTAKHKAQLQAYVASIITVLNCYQSDLEELLKQYKTYKKATISLSHPVQWSSKMFNPVVTYDANPLVLKDKELERETPAILINGLMINMVHFSSAEYVDYMFDNWTQLKEVKSYFSDLKEEIKPLIIQNDGFTMSRVLPVPGKQSAYKHCKQCGQRH